MTADVVVRAERLGKKYIIGHKSKRERHVTLRDGIARTATNTWRKTTDLVHGRAIVTGDTIEEFWALRQLSFEVKRGDVLGILGRNGSGKSTLLKILSRITEPTEGRVVLHGRVSSLLEVGMGFHPELTGRQNIFLNGAILGMKRAEIKRKFDEIVAFAETERFLDTPVKRYSSGMYVRLAFAVAAHLEPEIFIVDEVLAVGDASFQQKCLEKMRTIANSGSTVLFVSHNLATIGNLCNRGLVIDGGSLAFQGNSDDAIESHLRGLGPGGLPLAERVDRKGSGGVTATNISLKDRAGNSIHAVQSGGALAISIDFERHPDFLPSSEVVVTVTVKTSLHQPVFMHHNLLAGKSFSSLPKAGTFVFEIDELPIPPATYVVGYTIMQGGDYLDTLPHALDLNVVHGHFFGSADIPPATRGVCLVRGNWHLRSVSTAGME